jgi:arylformamidase
MLIDLSLPLNNHTPVFPGDPHLNFAQTTSIAKDGYQLHSLTLGSHSGTHIDAPSHMIKGSDSTDKIPLSTLVGKAKLIQGFSLDAVQSADLELHDIVVFYSGMSHKFTDPTYFSDYPVMPQETADYLVARQIKLVCVDTCSADITPDFPIHKTLLGAGIPIIENLTNLNELIDKSTNKSIELIALPLKIDVDGSPTRVIAKLI